MKLIPGGTDTSDRPTAIPTKFNPTPIATTIACAGFPSVALTHRPSTALPASDTARTGQCSTG